MGVYSLFNRPETIPCEAGTHYLNTYQEEIGKNGHKTLVKIGETNVYEKIQANAESCKIENILKAVAMGDQKALMQREATYCDTTTMPKNLMEAQNLVIRMKDEFYKMPMEVRKEFGNDPDVYVSKMGTEEFKDIMAPYNKKIADIQEAGNLKAYNEKVAAQAKFEKDVAAAKGGNEE